MSFGEAGEQRQPAWADADKKLRTSRTGTEWTERANRLGHSLQLIESVESLFGTLHPAKLLNVFGQGDDRSLVEGLLGRRPAVGLAVLA